MSVDFDGGDLLQVAVEVEGPDTVVRLVGELDLLSRYEFLSELDRAAAAHKGRVLVDLSEVRFIDASGLHALLQAEQELGGRLLVLGPSRAVRRLLNVTGHTSLLEH